MTCTASMPAAPPVTAPAPSAISYHCDRIGRRSRIARTTRNAQTRTSGATATVRTSVSATVAQASSSEVSTGTHQRGRARSMTTRTAMTGTEVPM